MTQPQRVWVSELDSDRFGLTCIRAEIESHGEIRQAFEFSKSAAADLLMIRCPSRDPAFAQSIESAGGRLMDTVVTFGVDLNDWSAAAPAASHNFEVRTIEDADAGRVAEIARMAFADYYSHYHADNRLPASLVDEIYPDWTRRLVGSGEETLRLGAFTADVVVAFMCTRLTSDGTAVGVLNAVHPAYQRQGVYSALLAESLSAAHSRSARRFTIETQIQNTRVQRVWVRTGLSPSHASYTFHVWFS